MALTIGLTEPFDSFLVSTLFIHFIREKPHVFFWFLTVLYERYISKVSSSLCLFTTLLTHQLSPHERAP